ncbi:MAG: type II secretion system protein [Proteobacteria bacterium]|nr:type II secretion system protein [Pseudomonadota bacterium]
MNNQNGFTLIEVLVTTALIFIITGLGAISVTSYKETAYQKVAEEMMGQVRLALEAGKQDSQAFGSSLMSVNLNVAGPASSDVTASLLLPGLVLPESFKVFVTHNPACGSAACVEDYVETRHCKINMKVTYFRTFGGAYALDPAASDGSGC